MQQTVICNEEGSLYQGKPCVGASCSKYDKVTYSYGHSKSYEGCRETVRNHVLAKL